MENKKGSSLVNIFVYLLIFILIVLIILPPVTRIFLKEDTTSSSNNNGNNSTNTVKTATALTCRKEVTVGTMIYNVTITSNYGNDILNKVTFNYSLPTTPDPTVTDNPVETEINTLRSTGLVEETNDFSTNVLTTSLFVVHDTLRSGQNNVTELTARKQVASPHLNLVHLDIETRRNAAALVQATNQLNHHLSGTVIVNHGDFTNVAYTIIPTSQLLTLLLHALKELQEHLRAGTDEHLTLSTLLSVGNGFQSVSKNIHQHGDSIRTISIPTLTATQRTLTSNFQKVA